jgi:hypothetical protein
MTTATCSFNPGAIGTITLSENDVTIIITPDIDSVENGQGKMLELWAEDIRCPVSDPNTCTTLGFCHLAGLCVDYTNLANARELIVRSNARVNLTNRPGFEVPPLGPETIYVEEVILEPNAVLNIGLQTLYYDTLTIRDANGVTIPGGDPNMNGSSIVNIPQLGFPLEVIRFEDQCEFATRVHRDATNGLIGTRELQRTRRDGHGGLWQWSGDRRQRQLCPGRRRHHSGQLRLPVADRESGYDLLYSAD